MKINDNDFMRQQQSAVERMRELSSRSVYSADVNRPMPPVPSFVKVNGQTQNADRRNNGYQSAAQPNYNKKENRPASSPVLKNENSPKTNSLFEGLNLPIIDNLKKDGDMTLIIGLLLLLLGEKTDKKLLFALIYILL